MLTGGPTPINTYPHISTPINTYPQVWEVRKAGFLSYIVENQVTVYRTSNRTNYIFNKYLEDTGYAPKYGSILYLGCRLVFSQDLNTLRSEEWPVSTRKPLRVFKLKQHTLVPAILHGYQPPNKLKDSDFPHKNDRKKICKKPKAQMQALAVAARIPAAKESA